MHLPCDHEAPITGHLKGKVLKRSHPKESFVKEFENNISHHDGKRMREISILSSAESESSECESGNFCLHINLYVK